MAVYRAYYGDALYGQDTYGLSGSITDGAAVITPSASVTVKAVNAISFAASDTSSASVTAGAEVVKQGAAAVTPSASVTSTANRVIDFASADTSTSTASASGGIIKDGAVAATLQNLVVSLAETYAEVDGYRSGYGLRTYGTNIYGENHSIEEGAATINTSATVTAVGQRVVDVSISVSASATFTSNGVIDVVGRATITPTCTVDIAYNRVRLMAASDRVSLTTDTFARYKWLDADDPTTTWTDASDPATTWSDADYLERAA